MSNSKTSKSETFEIDSDPEANFIGLLQNELLEIQEQNDPRPGIHSLTNNIAKYLCMIIGPERAFLFISTYTDRKEAFDLCVKYSNGRDFSNLFVSSSDPNLKETSEFPGLVRMSASELEALIQRYSSILVRCSEEEKEYYSSKLKYMVYLSVVKRFIETLTQTQIEALTARYQFNHLAHTTSKSETNLLNGFIHYLQEVRIQVES